MIGRELTWHRTRWLPARYELRAGTEPVGSIEWLRPFRSTARAAIDGREWTMWRPGLLSRRVSIEAVDGRPAAIYVGGLRGGILELADGRRFRLSAARPLPGTLRVGTLEGSGLLAVTWRWVPVKVAARVSVDAAGSGESELGLLACLAFYVLRLRRQRAAGASGGG